MIDGVSTGWIGRITICYKDDLLLRLSSANGLVHSDDGRRSIFYSINLIGGDLTALRGDKEADIVVFASYLNIREFITNGLLTSEKALELMILPDPTDESLYEPIREILEKYGNRYAVHARIRLGASPTLLSMGMEGFSYALQDKPALVEKVLDIYTNWSAELVNHLQKIGFSFLWAFDDIAYNSGPIFSPSVFKEIFLPRMRKVARNIKIPFQTSTVISWVVRWAASHLIRAMRQRLIEKHKHLLDRRRNNET